jgi:phosphate starvation-inducible PhoH-like protein
MGPIKKMPSHMIGKSGVNYQPRSENQKKYVEYLSNTSVPLVFGLGPAGCGKTLFACSTAVTALRSGSIDRIILTRPIVAADEELGFLPGSIEMKMDPWTRPIFDILGEFYSQTQIHSMVRDNIIEISPLAYMRGRTFKRSFIIADEMQNSTPNQMLMMTTRLGQGSRMVITGDLNQSDRGSENGLADMVKRLRKEEVNDLIRFIEMENQDIQRSHIVSYLIDLYDDGEKQILKKETLNKVQEVVSKKISGKKKDPIWDIFPNDDAALIPKSHYKPL